jgi:hypothetical protein
MNDRKNILNKYGGKSLGTAGMIDYKRFCKDVNDEVGGGETDWNKFPGLKDAIGDIVRFCNKVKLNIAKDFARREEKALS